MTVIKDEKPAWFSIWSCEVVKQIIADHVKLKKKNKTFELN